jgi:hypothetical protein
VPDGCSRPDWADSSTASSRLLRPGIAAAAAAGRIGRRRKFAGLLGVYGRCAPPELPNEFSACATTVMMLSSPPRECALYVRGLAKRRYITVAGYILKHET